MTLFGYNMKKSFVIAGFAITVIILIAIFAVLMIINSRINSITATAQDVNGIDINSKFVIKSSDYNRTDDLLKNLKLSTIDQFTVSKRFGDFILKFDSPLEENKIYTFSLKTKTEGDKSYAFQTKTDFSVRNTLPASGSYSVPVYSGIEISFTLPNFQNYEKYFEITPKVNGSFSKYGNTLVFIPDQLKENTSYRVTVKKGLSAETGESLQSDFSFKFETSNGDTNSPFIALSGDRVETFLSSDCPVVEIEASEDYANTEFTTEIFEVKSADDYAALIKKAEAGVSANDYNRNIYDIVDTAKYHKISDFKSELTRLEDVYESYIILRNSLPQGYYIVNISGELGGKKVLMQKFIQINDFAVYALSNNGSILLWVNDTKTGKPLSGAQVTIGSQAEGKTSSDGTVKLAIAGSINQVTEDQYVPNNDIVRIQSGNSKPFVTCLSLIAQDSNLPLNQKYYSYLYTDREGYLSTDTVRVFGLVRPRAGGEDLKAADVYVYSDSMTYNYGLYNQKIYDLNQALQKVPVKISDDGVFTADLKLDHYSSTYYDIILASSGKVITSKTITVEEYVKPTYDISFQDQLDAYFIGESVPINANVSFFDGTPAADFPMKATFNYGNEKNVITDRNGDINRKIKIERDDDYFDSWYPAFCPIILESKNADDTAVTNEKSVLVLPRTVMLETNIAGSAENPQIKIATHRVTKNRITKENINSNDLADIVRGASIDVPLKVKIVKNINVKKIENQYYNYVEKKTEYNYSYNIQTSTVSEKTVDTSDGALVLDDLPVSRDPDVWYTCELSCTDTNRQLIKSVVNYDVQFVCYMYSDTHSYYYTDNRYYRSGSFEEYDNSIVKHNVNDKVVIRLYEEESGAVNSGKVLYSVLKDGINNYSVSDSCTFQVNFEKQYVPNVFVGGAYFDGKHIFAVESCELYYDYECSAINIDTTPDKKSYKPGDTVNLQIAVTGKDGKPCAANVNVSVADEAVFSMYPQSIDFPASLYDYCILPGYCSEYVSYVEHNFGNIGAEKGGGEGSSIRRNFKDSAFFKVVKTGNDGKATLSFRLPDNLTSWRISTQAITSDNRAGNTVNNITTNLPFFADMVLNKTYLTGDDISVTACSYGTAFGNDIKSDASVEYTVTVVDPNDKSITEKVKKTSGTSAFVNFGKKSAGSYTMRVKAKCGSFSDTVEKLFEVKKNGTELLLSKTFDLNSQTIDVDALKSPVQLSFYNSQAESAYKSLLDMYSSNSGRNDAIYAKNCAAEILNSLSGGSQYAISDITSLKLQGDDGGALIYPYDSANPLLTARFIMANGKSLDRTEATAYLYSIIDGNVSDKETIAAAYFGLAAYKEPVLTRIQAILDADKNLHGKVKLLYACALSAIGDDTGAKSLFSRTYMSYMKINGDCAKLVFNTDDATNDEMTALSLYVLTRCNNVLAQKIVNNMLTNPSKTYLPSLEQIYYVDNSPQIASRSTLQYNLNGETKQITIKNFENKVLVMTTSQLKESKFKVINGQIHVRTLFTGSSDNLSSSGSTLSIDKLIDVSKSSCKIGQELKVTLFVTVKDPGFYDITDFIPSGARFINGGDITDYQENENTDYWLIKNEGQKVEFGLYKNDDFQYVVYEIAYYIRPVTVGNYRVESAFVACDDNWGFSDRGKIKFEN